MISEREQRSFVEFARPPLGMKLTYCIGTTFTLDFMGLVQLGLATQGEVSPQASVDLPTAFRQLNDFESRSIVFCQNCRIQKIPRELFKSGQTPRQRLLGLLDNSIHSIAPPAEKAAFHPKVWLLRFDATEKKIAPIWRLLVTSRNLTESQQWEIGSEFIGRAAESPVLKNGELIEFFKYLRQESRPSTKAQKILAMALKDLPTLSFDTPPPFKKHDFHWKLAKGRGFSVLDSSRYDKIIAISPFLSKSTLNDLAAVQQTLLITSTKDVRLLEGLDTLRKNSFVFNLDGIDLHAKVYLCRLTGNLGTDVFLGSANLTRSGMTPDGNNIEAMAILSSERDLVADFERKFIYQNYKTREPQPWLKRVDDDDIERSDELEKHEELQKHLELARERLSLGSFVLKRVSRQTWGLRWIGPSFEWPDSVQAELWVEGTDDPIDLRELIEVGKPISLKVRTPSAFVWIRLVDGKLPALEFGDVAEVIGDRSGRMISVLASIAPETDLATLLSALLPESTAILPVSPQFDNLRSTKTGHRNTNRITCIEGYVESFLLADLSNPERRAQVETVLLYHAPPHKPEHKALWEFWQTLVLAYNEVASNAA